MFTAELFNATEWAEIFADGACVCCNMFFWSFCKLRLMPLQCPFPCPFSAGIKYVVLTRWVALPR